jgi:hypothetical protein
MSTAMPPAGNDTDLKRYSEDAPRAPLAPPVLPTLPRTTNLMGPDSWKREIQTVAGPFAEDRAIIGALQAQRRMVESLEALEEVRKSRNPADTASGHLKRASEAYERMAAKSARNADEAIDKIAARRREVDQQVEATLGLHSSLDAAEIRSVLRGMSSGDRGKAIQAAIDSKDGAVLHAVFTGRELSTGVNDAQRKSVRRRAEEKYCPDLLKLRQGLDKAEALVKGAFDDVDALYTHVAGRAEVVSEFERQTAASDAAWLKFNGAIA